MALKIQVSNLAASNFPVNLLSSTINLRVYWCTRSEGWYLDVRNSDLQAVELGIRLSTEQPLIMFGLNSWPLDGNLYVAPTQTGDASGEALNRSNFGGVENYQLFYVSRAEADFLGGL
jgi:hypothetical protein